MENDIIYIELEASDAKEDMSMDIFASDTEDNNVKKTNDSNLSKDIFDVSDDEEEVLPSPSKQELKDADDSDIEILSPKKKERKGSEKENIVDEFDSIEIISPVKKEPKPFFIPPDPDKPKTDLSHHVKKKELSKEKKLRLTPILKKTVKEEEMKAAKKNLAKMLGSNVTGVKLKPGQTKIDSHFKLKKDKKPVVNETPKTPPLRPTETSKNYRTPSPRRPRGRGRSASPQFSPLPAHIAAQLKTALESPGFQARKHSALTTVLERAKQKAALRPRCKFSRALMNGYECACCKDHYDAMGLQGEERREYVNKVSKHRGFEQAPPTPPRYWDLDVPSKEEQVQLGYVIETDSPLFKKKQ